MSGRVFNRPRELNGADMTQINAQVFLHEGRLWIRINTYPGRFRNTALYVWVVDVDHARLATGYLVPFPHNNNGPNVVQYDVEQVVQQLVQQLVQPLVHQVIDQELEQACPCGRGAACCYRRMADRQ
ncbi:hypothetical protein CONLIGDRAFT_720083 [Coniochaeta ligniaria NRRL 30616]|uniref:Uncharacterized protein n=1 Tax=Coniochaeta ligniaria NRRL 30616 TaxID=1408157 RepID=A0A1J7I3P1_9PEZI|nr:hypothetical protein CONLIGDRAFT_720083 [Coniochaeta ligniaria NRRL 30616]